MQELIQFLIELAHDRAYAQIVIDMRDGKVDQPIQVTRKFKIENLPIRDRSRIRGGPATQ